MLRFYSRTAAAVALGMFPTIATAQTTGLSSPAAAQAAEPPVSPDVVGLAQPEPAPAARPQAPTEINLPGLSGVSLRVVDEVSSKTAIIGAPVRLALARPLYVTPELGVPAGTPVEGVVIHAAKGGMGGKSGELLLGAKRIVLSDTVSIPLRSFKLGPAKGQSNEGIAFGTAVAGGAVGAVASMFIVGGSAKVPAGTEANAKTSADTVIPVTLLSKLPAIPAIVVASAPTVPAPATQSTPNQGN